MFYGLYQLAKWLICISLFIFIIGFSLKVLGAQFFPFSGAQIVVLSSLFLGGSVPFGFSCLVSSYRNGVITFGNMTISLIASLFFFVFGYMAVMWMLGVNIKEYRRSAT